MLSAETRSRVDDLETEFIKIKDNNENITKNIDTKFE